VAGLEPYQLEDPPGVSSIYACYHFGQSAVLDPFFTRPKGSVRNSTLAADMRAAHELRLLASSH